MRKRTFILSVFLGFVIGFIFLIILRHKGVNASEVRSIDFRDRDLIFRESLDLGVVRPGEVIKRTIEVANSLKQKVIGLKTKSSCICTTASISSESIMPFEHATLHLAVDTSGRKGWTHGQVVVQGTDAEHRDVFGILNVDYVVLPEGGLSLTPDHLIFSQLNNFTQTIAITGTLDDLNKVTIDTGEQYEQFRLVKDKLASSKAGIYKREITFVCLKKGTEPINLQPITVALKSELIVIPCTRLLEGSDQKIFPDVLLLNKSGEHADMEYDIRVKSSDPIDIDSRGNCRGLVVILKDQKKDGEMTVCRLSVSFERNIAACTEVVDFYDLASRLKLGELSIISE